MKTTAKVRVSFALLLMTAGSLRAQDARQRPSHDKAFWRAVAANKYQVPEGQNSFELARELSGYLASPDPELRDDLAYTILAVWIVERRELAPAELLQLEAEWQANLGFGIGESNTDSVFKRSFSALCLAAVAERDRKTPFLSEGSFSALLDAALAYLRDERDLRGFDTSKGWIHATAHTADLLAALASNPLLSRQDQAEILKAVSRRLATANDVFTYGEQDRLANVVAAIASRSDFDLKGFRSWLSDMDKTDQAVWNDSPPKIAELRRFENDSYMLRDVVAHMLQKASPATASEAQAAVLKSLRNR